MDYDWKRELVEPEMHEAYLSTSSLHNGYHLYASSKPWATIQDFRDTRDQFDTWRHKHDGLLKTLDDWDQWSEHRKTSIASQGGVRKSKDGLVGQAKRTFLKAYTRSLWGLPGGDYKAVAEHLNEGWLQDHGERSRKRQEKQERSGG